MSGGNGGGETRVPIPNTTVKTSSADDTWGGSPWESRTPPGKRAKELSAYALGSFMYNQTSECEHMVQVSNPYSGPIYSSSAQLALKL
jgi:hypothetical protein